MTAGDYAAILGVWLAAIAAPGPDVALVLRASASGGRGAGLAAALGIAVGITVWLVLATVGAGAALGADATLLGVVRILGGAVLLVLAWSALRAARTGWGREHEDDVAPREHPAPGGRATTRRSFLTGLVTNLTNVKALVFFTAVFAGLVPRSASDADRILLAVVLVAAEALWFSALALLATTGRPGRWLGRNAPRIELASGLLFLAAGVAVAVEGLRGLA